MNHKITDPDVQLLAARSAALRGDYAEDEMAWLDSPFAWIKTRPSRQVGAIGEQLVAGWCAAKGLDVARSPDSNADRIIEGYRVEIKFSTLWKNGSYKFQQLRDQDYQLAICLGLSPFDAHCWILPKELILDGWGKAPGLASQHGGRAGSDTAWLSVNPNNVPEWLKHQGGTLRQGYQVLLTLVGKQRT
jgi:hypothetical protein